MFKLNLGYVIQIPTQKINESNSHNSFKFLHIYSMFSMTKSFFWMFSHVDDSGGRTTTQVDSRGHSNSVWLSAKQRELHKAVFCLAEVFKYRLDMLERLKKKGALLDHVAFNIPSKI